MSEPVTPQTATTCRAAIVTTLRDAGSAIDTFIDYHLGLGFERLFLFFDDPHDPDLPRLAAHPSITAIPHDDALRRAWKTQPEFSYFGPFIDREVMARQVLNVVMALDLARRDGLDWLLHIDADELFYSPNHAVPELFALASAQRPDSLLFPNFEAVPETIMVRDAFREVDLFKIPPFFDPGPWTPEGWDLLNATPQLAPDFRFNFYSSGKSAVRLGARDVRPNGVHGFFRTQGEAPPQPPPAAYVLHYACCGFDAFWEKYQRLGGFSDRWLDRDDIRSCIGPFHLDARDVVATGDRQAAQAFYGQRFAITDRSRAEALIQHGILRRIVEPRQLLARLDTVR